MIDASDQAWPYFRQKKTILLVDDESTFRICAAQVLIGAGFDVSEAENGATAFEMITERHARQDGFDLLITDLVMPGITGFDLIRQVRSHGLHLPILLITGFFDDAFQQGALDKDGVDILLKPFEPADLFRCARRLIAREGDAAREGSGHAGVQLPHPESGGSW